VCIKYIYTNSQHKNPLCRVAAIDSIYELKGKLDYAKEKYKEMLLEDRNSSGIFCF
jgi:hypothetical protein